MPKIITPAMRAHLNGETTRLARSRGSRGRTASSSSSRTHDRDIVFSGEVYRADAGFARTAIRSDAGFAVDNLDLVGVFAEGAIVEDEVRAGLFDGAEIRVSFVNWQDPDGHGEIRLRRGTLGETRLTPQGYFHAVGDLFVLLGGDGVTRRPLGLDRLGDTIHYRAVGRGGELRDARTAQLMLAGNDLKPYAPAQLEATGSWGSNVTLSWQRRTRVGGELIDGSGEVPLAEDSEQYDLEILLGNAVVRVGGLTGASYLYTSADQATDFPGFVAQGLANPGFETGDLSGWTVESGGTWTVENAHESLFGGHTGSPCASLRVRRRRAQVRRRVRPTRRGLRERVCRCAGYAMAPGRPPHAARWIG